MMKMQVISLRTNTAIICLMLLFVLRVRNIKYRCRFRTAEVRKPFREGDSENQLERLAFNFSPTINFRYQFSKRTRLQIAYRGKSRQPNIHDLQSVVDNANLLDIRAKTFLEAFLYKYVYGEFQFL